jgi:hypothetical protein
MSNKEVFTCKVKLSVDLNQSSKKIQGLVSTFYDIQEISLNDLASKPPRKISQTFDLKTQRIIEEQKLQIVNRI